MKEKQQVTNSNGIEVCLFPMKTSQCGPGPGYHTTSKVDVRYFFHCGL